MLFFIGQTKHRSIDVGYIGQGILKRKKNIRRYFGKKLPVINSFFWKRGKDRAEIGLRLKSKSRQLSKKKHRRKDGERGKSEFRDERAQGGGGEAFWNRTEGEAEQEIYRGIEK